MLQLERQKAKLTNLNPRAEKHGEEHIPAADLHFAFDAPNDVLSEFDPALKSSLYRKPDGNGDQQELINEPGYLPKLRFPKMSGFKWETVIKESVLVLHVGRSDIALDFADADQFKFEPMDGGTVMVSFRVQCHPNEKQIGQLYRLIQEDVEISLRQPEHALDAESVFPRPGEGAGAADRAPRSAE